MGGRVAVQRNRGAKHQPTAITAARGDCAARRLDHRARNKWPELRAGRRTAVVVGAVKDFRERGLINRRTDVFDFNRKQIAINRYLHVNLTAVDSPERVGREVAHDAIEVAWIDRSARQMRYVAFEAEVLAARLVRADFERLRNC